MPFFRRVLEEFEARLTPPGAASPSARGKTERKHYADGEQRLKVKARGLDLPDGARVEIVIADEVAAEVQVEQGRVRLDVTDSEGHVPEIKHGDIIQLRAEGVVHLRGEYRPD